jgi:hypothetical protein
VSWPWGSSTAAHRGFDTDGKITQVDNANGASVKNCTYDGAFRITGITDVCGPHLISQIATSKRWLVMCSRQSNNASLSKSYTATASDQTKLIAARFVP